MKKLVFIVIIGLHSTLHFASGIIPWPGNNPTYFSSYDSDTSAFSYVPELECNHSQTTISSLTKNLCDQSTYVLIQYAAVLMLSSFERQKKHTSRPEYVYDDSYLKADVATIEKWKLRGKTATKSTTQLQNATSEALVSSEAQATSCAQIRAILAACIDEDEVFWKLRDVYVDSGCEEPTDKIQELPENACYSIPFGATAAFYGVSHVAPLAGSAIGSAFLAAAPPLVICAVIYTGSKFVVSLIENHRTKHESPEFKLARDAAQKYASDFQSALDRTLHIGSLHAIPTNPIYYAMSYGYGDDPYAKVVTIVDKQQKQHIFVVPEDINAWPFQISDGSLDSYYAMHYRYLVPQSTIDAVIAMQGAQEKNAQEPKNKAAKDKNKAVSHDVDVPSNLTSNSQATQSSEMSGIESKAPEQQGCGHIDPEHSKSEILTSPISEPQVPSNEGCGKPINIEQRTDTAHTPDPEVTKIQDQSLPGGMDSNSHQSDLFNAQQKHEDLLPRSGNVPFEPKKQKGGQFLRDKQGGYIDKHNNSWNWDPIKEEWDVVGKKGHRNVNSEGVETHKGTHPDAKSGTSKSQKNR